MKAFLKHLLGFLLLFIVLCAIIEFQLSKNINNNHELQYAEVLHNTKHANAIIFGASHSTDGIRPAVLDSLGLRFYNFSFTGSNPKFNYYWYTNIFCNYYQEPLYCIYAIDWKMFDAKRKRRKYEQDAEFFPLWIFTKALFNPFQYDIRTLLSNRFCLFKYNTTDNLQYIFNKKKDYPPYVIEEYVDGFLPCTLDSATRERKFGSSDYNCLVSQEMVNYFQNLIVLLQEKNIKIIFVDPPEYGGSREIYEAMPAYHVLDSLCRINLIPFYSYNIKRRSFINENRNLFTDWDHLNSKGSQLFSNMLKNDLKTIIRRF